MKKEKSVKTESKKETKEKEKTTSNNIVFTKEVKKGVKIVAMITCFMATLACIFVFVFGIITSLKVANSTKEDLLHDNFSVTFISNLDGRSITETEDIIQGYGSKALFITFNIVLPALATIAALILAVILIKKLMDFVNSINREKDLFTKEKLHNVQKMACLAEAIITITFVIFGQPSLLLYIFTSSLIFIVIGLFDKCVEYRNNH